MIKTIIFDLSEVYLQGLMGVDKYISKKIGVLINHENLTVPELDQLFRGKISEIEYWKALITKYGWNLGVSDLQMIVRSNFKEIKGTRSIIEQIRKTDYQLGLLSDHAKEWIEYCEKKFQYHKLFHSVVYSFEKGVCKSERKSYEIILEKLNAIPEKSLFIDDNQDNLITASRLGIKIIKFESARDLKEKLKKLDINLI
ncbi:MAG: HAD-IA family hydrolase [Patescibacteria group bacterium]